MLDTLLQAPDWLTASALVIAGILLTLIANTLIVHTLRNTLGVRHPKTRSLLTRSKGPLRLAANGRAPEQLHREAIPELDSLNLRADRLGIPVCRLHRTSRESS